MRQTIACFKNKRRNEVYAEVRDDAQGPFVWWCDGCEHLNHREYSEKAVLAAAKKHAKKCNENMQGYYGV